MGPGDETKNGEPVLTIPDAAAFEAWLSGHHAQSTAVWVKLAKKASPTRTVSYVEAVEVALCWGWIDGQSGAWDASFSLQRFSPRRARSRWSQINRDRVARLNDTGRMQAPGLAAVEAARDDGRWDAAYAPPSRIEVPDDLRAALDAVPAAATFFATLDATNRYAVLYRTQDAKRPETRARRIVQFVEMLARGETLYPPKKGRVVKPPL